MRAELKMERMIPSTKALLMLMRQIKTGIVKEKKTALRGMS
jgi:hypothetical protein